MKLSAATYSRRDVLKLATSSTLITMLSTLSVGCSPNKHELESVAQRMIELLNHLSRASEIGAIYIDEAPNLKKLSVEQLTVNLLAILGLDPENVTDETMTSLGARLREQVRSDFVEENVVIVRGWMLSKTELLLCVLATTYAVTNPE